MHPGVYNLEQLMGVTSTLISYRLVPLAALATCLAAPAQTATPPHYTADLASLRQHHVPAWYADAKLGIFIHWGLYSVPGWAPISHPDHNFSANDYLKYDPYAEWYYNTMRIAGSPTAAYQREHYGDGDYYATFTPIFNQDSRTWNPDTWARIFKDAGAQYAVLTSKHHEGFTLWPSDVPNPNQKNLHAERDLVGAFTTSMRKAGLRAGLYYSGGYDWTFDRGPLEVNADYAAVQPQSHAYGIYADAQAEELIHRYHPDILWNDISWPKSGNAAQVIADYYNAVPEGLVDDRWGIGFGDYGSPEYETIHNVDPQKFEECRGLGASFGFNRAEGEKQTIAPQELIDMFVDIVSKNGNLLLDVGPDASGNIPAIQLDRLQKLGAWLHINGEAIYGTRPWPLDVPASASNRQPRAEAKSADGTEVRFTHKAQYTYAILLHSPRASSITIPDLTLQPGSAVKLLGSPATISWQAQGSGSTIHLPTTLPSEYAVVLRLQTRP